MVGAEQHLGGGGEVRRVATRLRAENHANISAVRIECPLLGVKRTSLGLAGMSTNDPKQTFASIVLRFDF